MADRAAAQGGVAILDREFRDQVYHKCFIGKDFVKWLKNAKIAKDEYHALDLGSQMLNQELFSPVRSEAKGHPYMAMNMLYRFKST